MALSNRQIKQAISSGTIRVLSDQPHRYGSHGLLLSIAKIQLPPRSHGTLYHLDSEVPDSDHGTMIPELEVQLNGLTHNEYPVGTQTIHSLRLIAEQQVVIPSNMRATLVPIASLFNAHIVLDFRPLVGTGELTPIAATIINTGITPFILSVGMEFAELVFEWMEGSMDPSIVSDIVPVTRVLDLMPPPMITDQQSKKD